MTPSRSYTGMLIAMAAVTVAAVPSHSEEEILQELILGESPYPQERGEWQFTLSASRFDFGNGDAFDVTQAIEYGIHERVQVGVELPYLALRPDEAPRQEGFAGPTVELLFSLLDPEERFVLSAAGEFAFPTEEFREEEDEDWDAELAVLAAWSFSRGTLYASAGRSVGGDESELELVTSGALDLGESCLLLELAHESEADESAWTASPGVAWTLPSEFELSAGLPFGLSEEATDWGVVVRLTWEFGGEAESNDGDDS